MPEAPVTPAIGFPFIELQSVGSTNNYARKQIASVTAQESPDRIPHGAVYFAREQIAGRGQRERTWVSGKDLNIAMSIVIDPGPLQIHDQFQLIACSAVSVMELFRKYAGADTRIKWPNDIYWQNRKAGGILIESGVRTPDPKQADPLTTANWDWAIIGIGINVNQTEFPPWLSNPVSLKQITGKDFQPVELAREICPVFENNYRQLLGDGFDEILQSYNANLYKRDQKARLKKENRVFEATIKGVSRHGKLCVSHAIDEEFDFGEIQWL